MSLISRLLLSSCFLAAGTALIAIYCPPYCVCHETVWRCSSRSVTEWPLDNLPHIIMRGVITLDMSKSNIEVLPNWPPTHNFPDLAMIILDDTVFDGERCHELECLQKLNLLVFSSCPATKCCTVYAAELRQGCSRAPCCYWSTPTTRHPVSTTAISAISSTEFPTLQESSFTRPMDATPADLIEQANENNLSLKEKELNERSSPVYDSITDHRGDGRLFFTVIESQAFEVTTEFSPRSPSTIVDTVSRVLPKYSPTTAQDVRTAGYDERQLHLTSHHLTELTTGQPASSRKSFFTGKNGGSSVKEDVTAGYDERVRHQQATLYQPTSIVEYVEISERMVKPPTRKPTILSILPTSITRTGWTADAVQLSASTTRPRVSSTRKPMFSLPEVSASIDRIWLTSQLPGSPEPTHKTDREKSTIGQSSLKNSSVTTTMESPHQTKEMKENPTSSPGKNQSARPTEGRYQDRLTTSPSHTTLRSTTPATDKTTTESSSLPSHRVSQASTVNTTMQIEVKSTEAGDTLGTTEMSAYRLSAEYTDIINSTEGLIVGITPWINTTGPPKLVSVTVLVAEQKTISGPKTTEPTTPAAETSSTSAAYTELSTAAEKELEDVKNSTDECTCPICPSCFTEFAGYQLSKQQMAGIAVSLAILGLAVVILLLKQFPATARFVDRITLSCGARKATREPTRPSFHHPGHHHFQGRPKRLSDEPWGNTDRTRPDTTVRTGDDGRFNNVHDQPGTRKPSHYRLPYVQEKVVIPVPRERQRRASVEILNEPHIPADQPNDDNPAGPLVEDDDSARDEGSVVAALDGAPVQLNADDALRMDTAGENRLGFIAVHGERQGDIELAAAASAGLLNPPDEQHPTSASFSGNVGAAGSIQGDDVVHEVNLSNDQEQQNEHHEANGSPSPAIQASPGRLAASFLRSPHPMLSGGEGENSTAHAVPGRNRQRPANVPSSAERATTRSVSRGLQVANAPLNASVSLDVVNES